MYGDVFVTFVEVRQENVLWFLQKNVVNDTNTRYNTNLAKTLPTSYMTSFGLENWELMFCLYKYSSMLLTIPPRLQDIDFFKDKQSVTRKTH